VVEITLADGPLDRRMLGWVAELYGAVDPRYRRQDFLEHLFVHGPGGPALHAFALADEAPVGHAAVVPTPARQGAEPLNAGKLEALVVTEEYRGRRGGRVPVAQTLLQRLYERSDERGIEVLHAYVAPAVGRAIGFTRLDGIGIPSLVALLRPRAGARRQAAEQGLRVGQRTARRIASVGMRALGRRVPDPMVRPVLAEDADLFATPPVPAGSWAVVADGALDWYASSPSIRILELNGADRSRALVQLPGSAGEPLRVSAWFSEAPGLQSAMRLLLAAGRLAEATGATTLRLQLQSSGSLTRAARLLGFVPRRDLTTLWVRTQDPSLAQPGAVVPTPMLYLGF
jgi:GNAT superfamily N-acetyltransferase